MWVPVAAENDDLPVQVEFWCSEDEPCELSRAQRSYLGMLDMMHEMMLQAVTALGADAPASSLPLAATHDDSRYVVDGRGSSGRAAGFAMHSAAAQWVRCSSAGNQLVWCSRQCGR